MILFVHLFQELLTAEIWTLWWKILVRKTPFLINAAILKCIICSFNIDSMVLDKYVSNSKTHSNIVYAGCSETDVISAIVSWWQKVVSQQTTCWVMKLSIKGLALWRIVLLTLQLSDWPSTRGHTCRLAELPVSLTTTHGLVSISPLASIIDDLNIPNSRSPEDLYSVAELL